MPFLISGEARKVTTAAIRATAMLLAKEDALQQTSTAKIGKNHLYASYPVLHLAESSLAALKH